MTTANISIAARFSRIALALLLCLPGGLCLCAEAEAEPVMAPAHGAGCCGETAEAPESGLSFQPAAALGCCADGCAMMCGKQPAEGELTALPAADRDGGAAVPGAMPAAAWTVPALERIRAAEHAPPALPARGHIALGVIVR